MKPLIALIVLAASLSIPRPANADEPEKAHCPKARLDDAGGEAVSCGYNEREGDPGADGLSPVELWHRYCNYLIDTGAQVDYADGATGEIEYGQRDLSAEEVDRRNLDPTGTYRRYIVHCHHPESGGSGTGATNIYTFAPPVPLTVLRARAKARINIDDPVIETNPSFTDRFTIVRIKTWLWVDQAYWDNEQVESETSGFVTVEVRAKPVWMEWSFNDPDNSRDGCNHPGKPWTRSAGDTDCYVEFTKSSAGQPNDAFEGTTEVSWEFSWSANGTDQGPFDDPFFATSNFELQVGEILAVES